MSNLSVAVLTGGHFFHVRPFIDFFNGIDGIDAYVHHFDQWLFGAGNDSFMDNGLRISRPDIRGDHGITEPPSDDQDMRDSYDVTLFYTMLRDEPDQKTTDSLERMLDSGMPIFVMHHALLNWGVGGLWSEVIGMPDRRIEVDDTWESTYEVQVNLRSPGCRRTIGLLDPGRDLCHRRLRGRLRRAPDDREHELDADPGLDPTRTGIRGVFCMQLGHDPRTWKHPAFGRLVRNGLLWCADRSLTAALAPRRACRSLNWDRGGFAWRRSY